MLNTELHETNAEHIITQPRFVVLFSIKQSNVPRRFFLTPQNSALFSVALRATKYKPEEMEYLKCSVTVRFNSDLRP
jgi:hypothetical protein